MIPSCTRCVVGYEEGMAKRFLMKIQRRLSGASRRPMTWMSTLHCCLLRPMPQRLRTSTIVAQRPPIKSSGSTSTCLASCKRMSMHSISSSRMPRSPSRDGDPLLHPFYCAIRSSPCRYPFHPYFRHPLVYPYFSAHYASVYPSWASIGISHFSNSIHFSSPCRCISLFFGIHWSTPLIF